MSIEIDISPFERETFSDLPLENIDLIISQIPIKDKKLFTVANTGIQNINFLNKDPIKIDSVDNDEYQIILNYLILSGIDNLEYIDFYKLFVGSPELKRDNSYIPFFDIKKFMLMIDIPLEYRDKAEKIMKEKYRLGNVKELTEDERKKNYNWLRDFSKLKRYVRGGRINLYQGDILEFIDEDIYDLIFLTNIRDVVSNHNKEYFKKYNHLLLNGCLENTQKKAYIYLTEYKDNLSEEDSLSNQNNEWRNGFDLVDKKKEKNRFEITHYLLKRKF